MKKINSEKKYPIQFVILIFILNLIHFGTFASIPEQNQERKTISKITCEGREIYILDFEYFIYFNSEQGYLNFLNSYPNCTVVQYYSQFKLLHFIDHEKHNAELFLQELRNKNYIRSSYYYKIVPFIEKSKNYLDPELYKNILPYQALKEDWFPGWIDPRPQVMTLTQDDVDAYLIAQDYLNNRIEPVGRDLDVIFNGVEVDGEKIIGIDVFDWLIIPSLATLPIPEVNDIVSSTIELGVDGYAVWQLVHIGYKLINGMNGDESVIQIFNDMVDIALIIPSYIFPPATLVGLGVKIAAAVVWEFYQCYLADQEEMINYWNAINEPYRNSQLISILPSAVFDDPYWINPLPINPNQPPLKYDKIEWIDPANPDSYLYFNIFYDVSEKELVIGIIANISAFENWFQLSLYTRLGIIYTGFDEAEPLSDFALYNTFDNRPLQQDDWKFFHTRIPVEALENLTTDKFLLAFKVLKRDVPASNWQLFDQGQGYIEKVFDNSCILNPSLIEIKITDPEESETVAGSVQIDAAVFSNPGNIPIDYFVFSIDDNVLDTVYTNPYTVSWNTGNYTNNSHQIKIMAFYDDETEYEYDAIEVNVDNTLAISYSLDEPYYMQLSNATLTTQVNDQFGNAVSNAQVLATLLGNTYSLSEDPAGSGNYKFIFLTPTSVGTFPINVTVSYQSYPIETESIDLIIFPEPEYGHNLGIDNLIIENGIQLGDPCTVTIPVKNHSEDYDETNVPLEVKLYDPNGVEIGDWDYIIDFIEAGHTLLDISHDFLIPEDGEEGYYVFKATVLLPIDENQSNNIKTKSQWIGLSDNYIYYRGNGEYLEGGITYNFVQGSFVYDIQLYQLNDACDQAKVYVWDIDGNLISGTSSVDFSICYLDEPLFLDNEKLMIVFTACFQGTPIAGWFNFGLGYLGQNGNEFGGIYPKEGLTYEEQQFVFNVESHDLYAGDPTIEFMNWEGDDGVIVETWNAYPDDYVNNGTIGQYYNWYITPPNGIEIRKYRFWVEFSQLASNGREWQKLRLKVESSHDMAIIDLEPPPGSQFTVGNPISVISIIENQGDFNESQITHIMDISGPNSFDLTLMNNLTLNIGESVEDTFNLFTSGLEPGLYNLTLTADIDNDSWPEDNDSTIQIELLPLPMMSLNTVLTTDSIYVNFNIEINCSITDPLGGVITDASVSAFIKEDQNIIDNIVLPYNANNNSYLNQYTAARSGKYTVEINAVKSGYQIEKDSIDFYVLSHHRLDLAALLEGPYDSLSGLMRTDLNPDYIPLEQPFNVPPWNYLGQESVPDIPNEEVVDWVLVELRDAQKDSTTATNGTVFNRKAGFILSNGKIVSLDGESPLDFGYLASNYLYAVIWHRNHLGVMSATPIDYSNFKYNWDFILDTSSTFGGLEAVNQLSEGKYGLIAGDANTDNKIDSLDKFYMWNLESGEKGYLSSDFSFDKHVNNLDKNEYYVKNINKSSSISEFNCGDIFYDYRDEKGYKTIAIDNHCWMAENLNIGIMIDKSSNQKNNNIIEKYCYGNNLNNCDTFGGLYQWNEMMKYSFSSLQGICPDSWHIPSETEWCMLTSYVDNTVNCSTYSWVFQSGLNVGSKLKSNHGWSANGNGTNEYGFNILPGGFAQGNGFVYIGAGSKFWSRTTLELDGICTKYLGMYSTLNGIAGGCSDFNTGFSIRCIKNEADVNVPVLETGSYYYDTTNNLIIDGAIIKTGSSPIIQMGHCYSTSENPTINDLRTEYSYMIGQDNYFSTISNLNVDSLYYFRAYAINGSGISYGHQLKVTPSELMVNNCPNLPTINYYGKTYNTVQIGEQCWMKENLNVGERIGASINMTNNSILEKYCYNDLEINCDKYGGLYSWNEMMQYVEDNGAQGICPDGWHIPTYSDINTLIDYLGGSTIAGGKLKESGYINWAYPNINASNITRFTSLPAGNIKWGEIFENIGSQTNYYTSTIIQQYNIAYTFRLLYSNDNVSIDFLENEISFLKGNSVRCLKNE